MKHLLYVLLLVGLSSCYYDNEEELYPIDPSACQSESVLFLKDIKPIISRNCATPGCHIPGGTGNGIFTNYEGLKAKVDNGSFKVRTLDVKDMPPNRGLNSCDIEKLRTWVSTGAKNN